MRLPRHASSEPRPECVADECVNSGGVPAADNQRHGDRCGTQLCVPGAAPERGAGVRVVTACYGDNVLAYDFEHDVIRRVLEGLE